MAKGKLIESNIENLIPDDKNFNKGTEFGGHLMDKSVREFGLGRSILIDKNNRIIAGNKTTETAMAMGIEDVQIIETDGTKLIAVKRTDIDLDTKKGREMALADNATSKANLEWDEEVLVEIAEEQCIDIEEWGVELEEEKETAILSGLEYNPVYYQPKQIPNLSLEKCVDLDKMIAKVKALDEYDLTEKQKEVLKMFAYRFIRIDYESVANYYFFNATEEEKKAIERLRLVFTDNGKKGFVEDDLLKINDMWEGGEEDD